jgi:hypothetical protein
MLTAWPVPLSVLCWSVCSSVHLPICMSVRMSVFLSVCLAILSLNIIFSQLGQPLCLFSVGLSVHLSICPSACLSVCLSSCLFVYTIIIHNMLTAWLVSLSVLSGSVCSPVHLSICMSVHMSVFLSVCLPHACLSVCLSIMSLYIICSQHG